jgi:hypothetical protein
VPGAPSAEFSRERETNFTFAGEMGLTGDTRDQQVEHAARLLRRTADQKDADEAGHHVVGVHVGPQGRVAGTKSIDHLEENIGAGDIVLSADQVARLDAVTAPGADPMPHGIERFVDQS